MYTSFITRKLFCQLVIQFESFLITDPHEIWLIEAVGSVWAAKKMGNIASISNVSALDMSYDLCSDNFHSVMGHSLRFSASVSDWEYTFFTHGFVDIFPLLNLKQSNVPQEHTNCFRKISVP